MAQTVIKRDGSKEPFDSGKINRGIMAAAKEGGLPEEQARKVADQVSATVLQAVANRQEVTTAELKARVLKELDRIAPAAAEAWRSYERSRGRS